jgi:5-methylthioadenosine/S-adenosylhomocysteine deaminase
MGDVIIVNGNQPHLVPLLNPVSTIVYCANGGDVETSIIDGRPVMSQRRLLTLDEASLLRKASEVAPIALQRAGLVHESGLPNKWEIV